MWAPIHAQYKKGFQGNRRKFSLPYEVCQKHRSEKVWQDILTLIEFPLKWQLHNQGGNCSRASSVNFADWYRSISIAWSTVYSVLILLLLLAHTAVCWHSDKPNNTIPTKHRPHSYLRYPFPIFPRSVSGLKWSWVESPTLTKFMWCMRVSISWNAHGHQTY